MDQQVIAYMVMDLFADAMGCLNLATNVEVSMDTVPITHMNTIAISRLKLNGMVNLYATIYTLVHKCLSNIPDSLCNEKTYVFISTIDAEYDSINQQRRSPRQLRDDNVLPELYNSEYAS